jgi:hypothetical protein
VSDKQGMPMGASSLMPSCGVEDLGIFDDDIYFDTDDTYYIGYDSAGAINYRPREIRYTRRLAQEFACGIGVTSTEAYGVVLRNSSPAALGAQQYSPSIYLAGQGYKTNATAGSQEVVFRQTVRPVQGAAAPTGLFALSASINGGAYTDCITVSSAGVLGIAGLSLSGDLLWTTDGAGNIGQAANFRPASIWATTTIRSAGTMRADTTMTVGTNLLCATDGGGDIGAAGANRFNNLYIKLAGVFGSTVTVGTNLLWATDGSGDVGASAATRPANIYALTSVQSAGTLVSGTTTTVGTNLLWATDGSGDIGAVAATRPNNCYVKLAIVAGTTMTVGTNLVWAGDGSGDIGAVAATRPNNIYVKLAGVVGTTFTVGTNLLWASDGSGDVGAAAATRPANIYGTTSVNLGNGANVLTTTAHTISGAMAIGNAPTEAKSLVLRNSTAAANGAQQWSPSIYLSGRGWGTGGGGSTEVLYRMETQPLQGATANAYFNLAVSVNGGGTWADVLTLDSSNAGSAILRQNSASLLWSFDNTGNIGQAAGYRPSSVYAATSINVGNGAAILTTTGFAISSALALGTAPTEAKGLVLENTTAAADAAQQASPAIYLAGQGFRSGAGTESQRDVWRIHNLPVQMAAAADTTAKLLFGVSIDAENPYRTIFSLNSVGSVGLPSWASASAPAGAAGDVAYCTDGDGGSPALAVYGAAWNYLSLAGGGGSVTQTLIFSDDTQYSEATTGFVTKKSFRIVLDDTDGLPTNYYAKCSVWVDGGSGDLQVLISDATDAHVSTIAFDAFANTSEAIVDGVVAIHASHAADEFLDVEFQLKTVATGPAYLKYTDFYLQY